MSEAPKQTKPEEIRFEDDGIIPNNPALPLLLYRAVFDDAADDCGASFESAYARNGWSDCWRGTVYPFHHYHSITHEVLGVAKGRARLHLGGPAGKVFEVSQGDALVIPAGVGHKKVEATGDFEVVGAYPEGSGYDMLRGQRGERPDAERKIAAVPAPPRDPIYGESGPLVVAWRRE